jgi:hypothetical protein
MYHGVGSSDLHACGRDVMRRNCLIWAVAASSWAADCQRREHRVGLALTQRSPLVSWTGRGGQKDPPGYLSLRLKGGLWLEPSLPTYAPAFCPPGGGACPYFFGVYVA